MTIDPEIIGMIAGFLTTVAYIPQLIKVLRYKHTKDLSLGMYSLITVGIFCWFLYGLMIGSPSVIYANGIACVMAAIILMMKLKHG